MGINSAKPKRWLSLNRRYRISPQYYIPETKKGNVINHIALLQ
jgi:hypothetical protein